MKRSAVVEAISNKKPKLQQTITSMFTGDLPTFVEAVGVQLQCPYCNRKLRAPQGLVINHNPHPSAGRTKVVDYYYLPNLQQSPVPLSIFSKK